MLSDADRTQVSALSGPSVRRPVPDSRHGPRSGGLLRWWAVYRFLLSPRWLGYAVLAALAAFVFVGLGVWQYHRARTVTPPVPAASADAVVRPLSVVLGGSTAVGGATAGQLVTVTGTWDAAGQAEVPDRPVDGRDGSWVVTPLRRPDGPAVLVVRGFVPAGTAVPAPPAGQVSVVGWLAGSEDAASRGTATADQVGSVSIPVFLNRVTYPLVDGFVGQTRVEPGGAAQGLVPVPLPGGGRGSVSWSYQSLGYALQWNLFALGAFVVLVLAARQQARETTARQVTETGLGDVTF